MITRQQLESLTKGTQLIEDNGKTYKFYKYDDSNRPVGVFDEDDDFSWKTLHSVSLVEISQPLKQLNHKKENTMESLKQYLEKNRDIFFTIGIVLILDHFVFGGAFREKLRAIVDSFLDKKTKEITNGK